MHVVGASLCLISDLSCLCILFALPAANMKQHGDIAPTHALSSNTEANWLPLAGH